MAVLNIKGYEVLVDDSDLEALRGITLRIRRMGKVQYVEMKHEGRTSSLHRLLMGFPEGFMVDHINGDGLDNRRQNLRLCTHAENMQNRRMHSNNACGVKGVYFDAPRGKYRASIRAFGQKFSLGSYRHIEEAKAAYESASRYLHGAFSRVTTGA